MKGRARLEEFAGESGIETRGERVPELAVDGMPAGKVDEHRFDASELIAGADMEDVARLGNPRIGNAGCGTISGRKWAHGERGFPDFGHALGP